MDNDREWTHSQNSCHDNTNCLKNKKAVRFRGLPHYQLINYQLSIKKLSIIHYSAISTNSMSKISSCPAKK